jgi:hypothetical protein
VLGLRTWPSLQQPELVDFTITFYSAASNLHQSLYSSPGPCPHRHAPFSALRRCSVVSLAHPGAMRSALRSVRSQHHCIASEPGHTCTVHTWTLNMSFCLFAGAGPAPRGFRTQVALTLLVPARGRITAPARRRSYNVIGCLSTDSALLCFIFALQPFGAGPAPRGFRTRVLLSPSVPAGCRITAPARRRSYNMIGSYFSRSAFFHVWHMFAQPFGAARLPDWSRDLSAPSAPPGAEDQITIGPDRLSTSAFSSAIVSPASCSI